MTAYVQARRAEGIHRFQLKVGADPYEDAARTRSVVAATGPEDIIVADANGGWRLQDAVVVQSLRTELGENAVAQCHLVREAHAFPCLTSMPVI